MSDWRTIDTLPQKDIGRIFCWSSKHGIMWGRYYDAEEFDDLGPSCWEFTDFEDRALLDAVPTHWHAMLSPPTSKPELKLVGAAK